jgi:hypothetical protein
LMAQLRNLLAEDEDGEEKESSEDDEDSDVAAMLNAMGMDSEEEDMESAMHEDMESYMDEEGSMEDMDAEMHRLMNDDEMGMDSDFDDMMLNDLMLSPEVDPLPGLMGDDEDLVLAQLTNRSAKKASKPVAKPAPKKSGVKSLGRVTTASASSKEDEMLARLWKTDPDVSKVFKP